MKKQTRLIALLLALITCASVFSACDKKDQPSDTSADTSDVTTASNEKPGDSSEKPEEDSTVITVADAKGSTGLTGDVKAAFAAEAGAEVSITGEAGTPVCHAIYATFSSPTVVTQLILTAPTKKQTAMASATIDGSTDGVNWVTLKQLGSAITSGKTYTLNVSDDTAYLYIRVRQADEHRTEEFAFRTVQIMGIARSGEGGKLENIVEETDESTLIAMTKYVASSTSSGNCEDVFLDNENSWTAGASSAGSPNFLISTMTKKTEIRAITVKLWEKNKRPRGTKVQASTDGKTWTDLYTIEDIGTEETMERTVYLNDTTQYSFIRLVQKESLAEYDWTLNSVLIYGIESEEDAAELPRKYVDAATVSVTYKDSHLDPHTTDIGPESIWDTSDKTTQWTNKEHGDLTVREIYWISGEMAGPTVITQIIYYCPKSHAERVRTSYFEASVDGENWVKIATLPGASSLYGSGKSITLTIDDDTAYRYIRLVQGEGFYKYYWTLGTVEIKGVSGN